MKLSKIDRDPGDHNSQMMTGSEFRKLFKEGIPGVLVCPSMSYAGRYPESAPNLHLNGWGEYATFPWYQYERDLYASHETLAAFR